MVKVEFSNSWVDTKAQAECKYGEIGREIACLRQGQSKGSKGLICACIEEAGYDVFELLGKWKRPYSSLGLAEVCRLEADELETKI